jgi:predicted amidohydrolase
MARIVTIAAGQVGPVPDDREKTVQLLMDQLDEAASEGVEVLSFTECCLTYFFPPTLDRDFNKFFVECPSPLTDPLFAKAKALGMALVFPFAEKAGNGFYNAAVVADTDGRLLGRYRKVHLPGVFPSDKPGGTGSFERLYFAPGDLGFPVFETAKGKVGVQICYDRKFPEGFRSLALDGAEMIFVPTNAATYGETRERATTWELPIRCRAYENGCYVVVPNKAGVERGRRHIGRSLVVSPYGEILAEARTDGWEVVHATVNLDEVARARFGLPFWRDRRPDTYGRLLRM